MVVVIGGGLSGLSIAYYLTKRLVKEPVHVIEASNRIGGWIKTSKTKQGHLFEEGPRTIRPVGIQGANTLQLISELGLQNKIKPIKSSASAAQNRMVYVKSQLHVLPKNIMNVIKRTPPFSKPLLVSMLSGLFVSKSQHSDESIYNFIERHFGHELADYAISPLICGICAGDAKEISVKFLLKNMFDGEKRHGNLAKYLINNYFESSKARKHINELRTTNKLFNKAKMERWSMYSLDGGLESLPKRLYSVLDARENVQIDLERPVARITFAKDVINVETRDKPIKTAGVISSILPGKLAKLIRHQHPTLAEQLETIPSVKVVVVNLFYKTPHEHLDAFGFLVPPSQKLPILGVIFDSCCFNINKQCTMLTVMLGGRFHDAYFKGNFTSEDYLHVAVKYIADILKITEAPCEFKVNILNDCIPQYTVGHFERLQNINRYIQQNQLNLSLCGSAYNGVGINDVILNAKDTVDALTTSFTTN